MEFSPWPENTFLKILAYIWSSITMIPSLLIIGILTCFKQITNRGWKNGAWEFTFTENSWLQDKLGAKYNGFSFGWCILYSKNGYNNLTVRMHERVHLAQQLKLSIFQWIFYGLFYALIYFGTNLDPYFANPFEVDARIQAGQNTNNLSRK